jgi:hypothetical protein
MSLMARPINYEADIEARIDALIHQLAHAPWNAHLLNELRLEGLRRIAERKRRGKLPKVPGESDLMSVYREMAWEPTRIEPLLRISGLAELVRAKECDDSGDATLVSDWAVTLIRRMSQSEGARRLQLTGELL